MAERTRKSKERAATGPSGTAPALVLPSPDVVDEDVRAAPEPQPEPDSAPDVLSPAAALPPYIVHRRDYALLRGHDPQGQPDAWLVVVRGVPVAECESEAEARAWLKGN